MATNFLMVVINHFAFTAPILCICCSLMHLLKAHVLGEVCWAVKASQSQSTPYKTPYLCWWHWVLTCSSSSIRPKAKPSFIGSQCVVASNRNNQSFMAGTTNLVWPRHDQSCMDETPLPSNNPDDSSVMRCCASIDQSQRLVPNYQVTCYRKINYLQ